jgi:hypothetical protein
VVDESRQVSEGGGTAVVLASEPSMWSKETFAPGVRLIALSNLAGHWPISTEQLVLFRGPRFVLRRVLGKGTPRADRFVRAYERRIARPIHRRVFQPAYGRLWRRRVNQPLDAFWQKNRNRFDAIVVTDAMSFPAAEHLLAQGGTPTMVFRLDQLLNPVG